jgi:hypothetical protein
MFGDVRLTRAAWRRSATYFVPSQLPSERRVSDVIVQAKKTADETRKATMKLTLWLAASMLAGAMAAMLGVVEGGFLRDSKWWEPGWRATVVRIIERRENDAWHPVAARRSAQIILLLMLLGGL